MKILITGIAGFIGSHVAEKSLERGDEVVGLDNLETGRIDNVPDGVMFLPNDINESTARHFLAGFNPDVIVHAAASYKDPNDVFRHIRTNTEGTYMMAEIAKIIGARLIYFQTSLCYGETQINPIPVQHPLNPQNSYAISKTAGESYIRNLGVDYVSFRLANVYGPRNLSGPIPTFFKNLMEGKKSIVKNTKRDFVYIDDLVRVVMRAIDGEGMGVFHVSTGTSYRIANIYNAVCMRVGTIGKMEEQEPSEDDVYDLCLEPNSLYELPSTPMEIGIKSTVEWYGENPVDKTFTHLRDISNDS